MLVSAVDRSLDLDCQKLLRYFRLKKQQLLQLQALGTRSPVLALNAFAEIASTIEAIEEKTDYLAGKKTCPVFFGGCFCIFHISWNSLSLFVSPSKNEALLVSLCPSPSLRCSSLSHSISLSFSFCPSLSSVAPCHSIFHPVPLHTRLPLLCLYLSCLPNL